MNGWVINAFSLQRSRSSENILGSHVEFHEGFDRSSSSGVARGDGLGAKETRFLARIEVDLDRGGWLETRGNQSAEDLNGIDSTGTILSGRNEVSATDIKYDLETKCTSSAPGARPVLGESRLIESW